MSIDRYNPADDHANSVYPYIPDGDLKQAVNMAIALKRPLLVKGPPGCGKTKLAGSIAHELGVPLYEWYVKSTSRARDGLYSIDMVRRLQDANLGKPEAQKLMNYLSFGPLGQAIRHNEECVVLIDEIDKADIDFPNDLLRELEESKFTIEELNDGELTDDDESNGFRKTYEATVGSPIVVITSNDEKELPEAFLRRCIFHYIDFPREDQLVNIIRVNVPDLDIEEHLVKFTVTQLTRIRQLGTFRKQPATSELIDWVRILHLWGINISDYMEDIPVSDLPFWKVLFKHQQDWQTVERNLGA